MDLALWQISQVIRGDAASRTIFDSQSGAALAAAYRAGALPAAAQQALEPFMARYGSRGLAEIDLGRPRWSEDPAHVMDVVAGYLRITDAEQAPDAVFARGAASSAAVIDELVAAARRGRRGWLRARLVRFAAGRARSLMALRESPKFFAVRLFGLIRAELLSVGQELAADGELGAPDDLFYLSFAELAAFAAGEPADWAGSDCRAAGRVSPRRAPAAGPTAAVERRPRLLCGPAAGGQRGRRLAGGQPRVTGQRRGFRAAWCSTRAGRNFCRARSWCAPAPIPRGRRSS